MTLTKSYYFCDAVAKRHAVRSPEFFRYRVEVPFMLIVLTPTGDSDG